MKNTVFAVALAATTVFLCACPSAKTPAPPPAPAPPSAMVVSLDAMEIAAVTAAPWLPGPTGQWMMLVAPTAQQIATDLQQPNPFAQAQAIDQTLRNVLASEPAVSTMSDTQQKMAASVVGAIDAFLMIYEQQAGIQPAGGLAAHAKHVPAGYPMNDADISILRQIAKGK